jgi:hypothetical protein
LLIDALKKSSNTISQLPKTDGELVRIYPSRDKLSHRSATRRADTQPASQPTEAISINQESINRLAKSVDHATRVKPDVYRDQFLPTVTLNQQIQLALAGAYDAPGEMALPTDAEQARAFLDSPLRTDFAEKGFSKRLRLIRVDLLRAKAEHFLPTPPVR